MSDTSTVADTQPEAQPQTDAEGASSDGGPKQLRDRLAAIEAENTTLKEQVRSGLVQRHGLDTSKPWVNQLVKSYPGPLTDDAFRKWATEEMGLELGAAKDSDKGEAPKPPTGLDPSRQDFQTRRAQVQDASTEATEQMPWDDYKAALDDPARVDAAVAALKAGKVAVPPHLAKAAGLRSHQ